jgi:hypothetical protein
MSENPYKLAGGNPAGSLAQNTITAIGDIFSGRAKRKADIANKLLDSDLRIRESKTAIKTQGKVERKNYSSQIKTNAKAAERLTGTEKGKGVTEPGTKFKMTPTNLELTTKKSKAPAATAKMPTAKSTRPAPTSKTSTVKETAKAVAKNAGKQLASTAKEGAVALGAAAGGALTKSPAGARAGAAVAQVAADAVEKGVRKAVANRKAAAPKPTARKAK